MNRKLSSACYIGSLAGSLSFRFWFGTTLGRGLYWKTRSSPIRLQRHLLTIYCKSSCWSSCRGFLRLIELSSSLEPPCDSSIKDCMPSKPCSALDAIPQWLLLHPQHMLPMSHKADAPRLWRDGPSLHSFNSSLSRPNINRSSRSPPSPRLLRAALPPPHNQQRLPITPAFTGPSHHHSHPQRPSTAATARHARRSCPSRP